MKNSSWTGKA